MEGMCVIQTKKKKKDPNKFLLNVFQEKVKEIKYI